MISASRYVIVLVLALSAVSCRKPGSIEPFEDQYWYAGGGQTAFVSGGGAFGQSFSGMTAAENMNHAVGDLAFGSTFVSAPAPKNPGLGPLFNSVSCTSCHISDGRGKPPGPGESLVSMLFRISVPGQDPHGGPLDVPGFGGQFQQRATFGVQAEGNVQITYTSTTITFPDGTTCQLRAPVYTLIDVYTAIAGDVMVSPRVAPPVFGLGLLEAIPESSILAKQDIYDTDGDGISGKANYVWHVLENQKVLGRFGWKANSPDILQQTASAYVQDMGITNFLFPQESSWGQPQYAKFSEGVELSDSLLYATSFYLRSLKVPAARNVKDADVQRGRELFTSAQCASCHTPKQRTGTNVAFKSVSNQLIFPYTDLLLHDMGEGLADNRQDFLANGNEWRTPPLWGIGLTEIVNGHGYFLHDGRARNLTEAIMWHGGEAFNAREKFRTMSTADRNALLKFLKSL